MDWTEVDPQDCAVTKAMDAIGDRWSVLVLREVFNGVRRFDDIAGHIGVSRSVLTQRLKALMSQGILQKRAYRPPGERVRYEYRLTAMGRDLQIVMQALMEFGEQWLDDSGDPPMVIRHRDCDAEVHVRSVCEAGHSIDEPRDLYGEVAVRAAATS